jgi:hypothetical protein
VEDVSTASSLLPHPDCDMARRRGSENESLDSESQGSNLHELQERLFVPEPAPFGDALSEYGSIRRDLAGAGLIDNNADGPIFSAPWPGTSVHEGAEAPGWGSEELPSVVGDRTLLETRVRKAARAALANGYRPPRTVAQHRRTVEITASLARYLYKRGRDPRRAVWQYALRKRELAIAEFTEAFWTAIGLLFEKPRERRARLRAEIRADRAAGLSIRQIAQARGIPRSTASDYLKNPDT